MAVKKATKKKTGKTITARQKGKPASSTQGVKKMKVSSLKSFKEKKMKIIGGTQ